MGRFKSKLVRRLASATFIARNLFILGITLYTPCVAMNTIVAVPYWASFLLMTALGICFTVFVSVIKLVRKFFVIIHRN